MPRLPTEIEYGEKYYDDYFEYRSVVLPKAVFRMMPHTSGTLSESEWRALGIQQSRGWVHYSQHRPEPYILLFRRPKGTDPSTGLPPRGFKYPEEISSTDINNCDNKVTTKENTNQQTNWRLEGFNNTQ